MKSHVSILLEIAENVYLDATAKCSAQVFQKRDLETLRSRVKHEGVSFLTITLPDFAKDFERSLELGQIDSQYFRGFRKYKAIPAFLRGMLSLLFDVETGRMLHYVETENAFSRAQEDNRDNRCSRGIWDRPGENTPEVEYSETRGEEKQQDIHCSTLIESIRGICRAFAKLELPCGPVRDRKAFEAFQKTEQELLGAMPQEGELLASKEISKTSFYLWAPVLSSISLDKVRCAHGPGATVEGISPNGKYRWTAWPVGLEPYFPILDNCYVVNAWDSSEFEKVTNRSSEDHVPVKVTAVPKTLRAPRIIAIEPVAMQFAQQGIRAELYSRLESSGCTKGQINFTDQSINRRMALSSSIDRSYITLDLSDASDRVPRSLALSMFDFHPDLKDAIEACTSKMARMPDGTIVPLRKFASMGNALCFPVEAMYFYTICVMALLEKRNLPISFDNLKLVVKKIFVYGDDIIVPRDDADAVLAHLQKYFCKVNSRKTFIHGFFRESCGTDAYQGYEVTPTYLRKLCPENRHQANRLISWTKTAGLFYKKGYWRTAELLYRAVERILGPLPYVLENSASLGRISFQNKTTIQRWNEKLHRFEFRGFVPKPIYRTDRLEGYAALTKCLRTSFEDRDPLHLERTALHGEAALKRRWVPSY